MSAEAILVSWKPPAHPNGLITKYKVYVKSSAEKENKEFEIPANQMSYEASGLNQNLPYEFWVSALTQIGNMTKISLVLSFSHLLFQNLRRGSNF